MAAEVVIAAAPEVTRDAMRNGGPAADLARYRLFRLGGAAALIAGLLFRRNMDAELMMLRSTGLLPGGPLTAPADVVGWCGLLQGERLTGLVLLGLFDIVNYLLVTLIFLAACVALWRPSRTLAALAAALTLAGASLYLASNQAFAMLALSDRYVSASDVARPLLLGEGQALLAVHSNATYQGSIYPAFLLVSAAGLVLALAMLDSGVFGKRAAWIGILANVFGLSYYLARALAPGLVALPLSVSAVFLLVWYILIGRRLLQMRRA